MILSEGRYDPICLSRQVSIDILLKICSKPDVYIDCGASPPLGSFHPVYYAGTSLGISMEWLTMSTYLSKVNEINLNDYCLKGKRMSAMHSLPVSSLRR